MLDNELIKAFYPIIKQGFIDLGLLNVIVRQAYQPVQQGTETSPSVYFFKLFDKRYGSPEKLSFYDVGDDQNKQIYRQLYETTFQVSALSAQDPRNTNSLTSSDLVNLTSEILQLDSAIQQLEQNEIGILRITDIRNTMFTDDRGQFEESPSFDFTLRHIQDRLLDIDYISTIESGLYRV